MVFVIAMLHGVPVFFLGIWSRSRLLLTVAAIASVGLALLTGNQHYVSADILAVIIAWVCGMVALNDGSTPTIQTEHPAAVPSARDAPTTNPAPAPARAAPAKEPVASSKWSSYIGHVVVLAILFFLAIDARGGAAGIIFLLISATFAHAMFKK